MSVELHGKWQRLIERLRRERRLLIAFSGGCDSAFLAAAARQELGKENVLAVTAVSASLTVREKESVRDFVARFDIAHAYLETNELQDPNYAANPTNRCFFCKQELFSHLAPLAHSHDMRLADGVNASDRSDYRPGLQAAQAWGVLHPLEQADLYKEDIRALSRWLRLPTWNKPASPCLSSRLPYGTPVTSEALVQIEKAESVLHAEGFDVVRVRHQGSQARIEVLPSEIARLQETAVWGRVDSALRKIGYAEVEIDPRGFKSGRLNEIVQIYDGNA